MDTNLSTLIDTAIKREEEAYRFYTEIQGRTQDPAVTEALQWIASEEQNHKAFLVKYREGGFGPTPLRMSAVVFYRIAEHQQEPDPSGALSPAEVFLVGAHREARSHAFYRELAQEHPAGSVKEMLLRMANEELKHKEKLEYLYSNTAFAQTSGG
ncbi:MAG: ferritin family protein [Desulfobacterales bacterium]|jgi:rubrerythrin|nr:ferritin family protein [Desulfobacterales bacterium]